MRLPVRLPPSMAPQPRGDWTVLLDDAGTRRMRTCTLCGNPVVEMELTSWTNGVVTVAVMLCPLCQRRDPGRDQVDALLCTRYHQNRYDHPS